MTVSASLNRKATRPGFGSRGWAAFLVLTALVAGWATIGYWKTPQLSGYSTNQTPGTITATGMRQLAFEKVMEKRVTTLVATVFGPDNVRVTLHADLDFSNRQTITEKFDPDGQVARSSFNRTGGREAATASSDAPFEEKVEFEISRSTSTVIEEEGTIQKLSAAVLINTEAGDFPPEQLQKIEPLIRTAMGFDAGRGDQLEIAFLPFSTIAPGLPDVFGLGRNQYTNVLVFAGVAVGFLLLIAAFKLGKKHPVTRLAESESPSDHDVPQILSDPSAEITETSGIKPSLSTSEMRAHVAQLVDQNPDHALAIMRSWLHEQTDQEATQ